MCLPFHSVKEPSKNHDIWVRGFCSVLYGVRFGSVRVLVQHFLLSGSVQFSAKSGFLFGSFLLRFGSLPSLFLMVSTPTKAWTCPRSKRYTFLVNRNNSARVPFLTDANSDSSVTDIRKRAADQLWSALNSQHPLRALPNRVRRQPSSNSDETLLKFNRNRLTVPFTAL